MSLLREAMRGDRGGILLLISLALLCVLVPIGALVVPDSSSFHLSSYAVTLTGKFLTYALLALALDLVWGYAGLLSLGHGAFFALGGYAMGMYLMRQIGDRGVYGNPLLPDFMVFLDWERLPWFWNGFEYFPVAVAAALFVPAALAGLVGWFAFRSRVSGVYFSIITQAVTYAMALAFYMNELGLGGNNGLTDFKDILGAPLSQPATRVALCVATALTLAAVYVGLRMLLVSHFGQVLVAARDADGRVRFLGYRADQFKLVAFMLSAMIAGIAGALFVPQVGIINPRELEPISSIEIVIWVAVGGRASLHGAVVGALLVNLAKSWFTARLPEQWLFMLGALFVLVTLYLPRGVVGLMARARAEGTR
jgi:urea transport system permease protein